MTNSRPATLSVDVLLDHADFVRALARSLLADPNAADDVAQDTWLAALEAPPRQVSRSWFASVVRNFARQKARGESRRRSREEHGARSEHVASVDEIAQREATRAELVRAVLALPEPSRTALLMRFYDGREPREIARLTGAPIETVRTRIKRGLARLREDLESDHGKAWIGALAPLAAMSATSGKATASVLAAGVTKAWIAGAAAALAVVVWIVASDGAPPPTLGAGTATTLVAEKQEEPLGESRAATRQPAIAPLAGARDARIAGTVVDARGAEIADAVVYFSKDGPPPSGLAYFDGLERELAKQGLEVEWARTDARGRFTHRAQPGERAYVAVVSVRDPLLSPERGDVREVSAPADDLRFVLRDVPRATIDVRVFAGREGARIEDFTCSFQRDSDKRVFSAKARGRDLTYVMPLTDAPADEIGVSVHDESLGTVSDRVTVTPGERVSVVLQYPETSVVRGRVVDERGAPITRAFAYSGTQREIRGDELFKPFQPERVRAKYVLTDASGAFELPASGDCVTVWHETFTPITVLASEAARIVMQGRTELRVRVLGDDGRPWKGAVVHIDQTRVATTDLAGVAIFEGVERGVRGLTLPGKRMVAVTVDRPDVQEVDVGPWLRDVELDSAEIVEHVSKGRESVLVGLGGTTSLVSIRPKSRSVTLPYVLPGSYLLVTDRGFFARVDIANDGAVSLREDERRFRLRVETKWPARTFIAPADANELVRLVCQRIAVTDRARDWEAVPEGKWFVAFEEACSGKIVDVARQDATVTIE